ncbi:MAG: AI-2E family transporter [Limnochordales bacterium]|nr:AI-2E family transporter [Limnochordales bacterium]
MTRHLLPRWGAVAALYLLGLALLFYLRALLLPFLVALLLSYLVQPLVEQLQKGGLKRSVAAAVVLLALMAGAVLAGILVIPAAGRELGRAVQQVPLTGTPAGLLMGWTDRVLPGRWWGLTGMLHAEIQRWSREMVHRAVDASGNLVSVAYTLLLAPFIAYYFLLDAERLREGVLRRLPPGWRGQVRMLSQEVGRMLAGFVRGQLVVSVVVGAVTAAAMYLLRIPYPLVIGLLAGLLDVIPYFGPVLAAIPAVVTGFLVSTWTPVWVVLAFLIIHQLESILLVPRVMGNLTGLHPLAVLGAILVGERVLGLTGMLLAVPVTAIGRILLDHLVAPPVQTAASTRQLPLPLVLEGQPGGPADPPARVDKLDRLGYDGEDSDSDRKN